MKRTIWVLLVTIMIIVAGKNASANTALLAEFSESAIFVEEFTGLFNTPISWNPHNWDVSVHSRDVDTWHELEAMDAHHGMDCKSAPSTHTITAYEDTIFRCQEHIMTAITAEAYATIYMTPDRMVDFSQQEAIITWDMSTSRESSRDWVDLWITPYDKNVQLPLEDWLPDLSGPPQDAIHIRMDFSWTSKWKAEIIKDFETIEVEGTDDWWRGYEDVLTPDPIRQDRFELRISDTHIKFGMPDYDIWWVDTDIEELGWDTGVVQFGHHSYNPEKACDFDGTCGPNTWHWDNMFIAPAIPFTMIPSLSRYVDDTTGPDMNFMQPAPPNAHLRFAGIGFDLEVSYDHGQTWQAAEMQALNPEYLVDDHFKSYWMEIPEGTESVQFRGNEWWGGPWHVRDVSVWSNNTAIPTAVAMGGESAENSTNTLSLALATGLTLTSFVVFQKRETN